MQILNLIANIILTISGMIFILLLYGRDESVVNRWKFANHWGLKFGLASFVSGTLGNALLFEKTSDSQILTNVGLAAIFTWSVFFHYKIFNKKK